MATFTKGLAGVLVAETVICPVGAEGIDEILYFGYPLCEMSEKFCFDECAYLLLYKAMPTDEQLKSFKGRVAASRTLQPSLKQALELMPGNCPPMDVLRTTSSFSGLLHPEDGDAPYSEEAALRVFERALGAFPAAMLYWHHFHTSQKKVDTSSPAEESVSQHFLRVLHGNESPVAASQLAVRALDGSLILYAEHDITASTFTSRVCASTLSDAWSCLTGAIGTLKGPLHGGANEAAHKMLKEWRDPEAAIAGVKSKLAKKELIFGFGHRVYMKKGDPRNAIAKKLSKALSESDLPHANPSLFAVSEAAETTMVEGKGIKPNLDFYTASLYEQLGIPVGLFTPIFVFSRIMGWAAHVLEQRANNRLIRPSAKYLGKPTQMLPRSVVFTSAFDAETGAAAKMQKTA